MSMRFIALIIISIANLLLGTSIILCSDVFNSQRNPTSVFTFMLLFELLLAGVLFPDAL